MMSSKRKIDESYTRENTKEEIIIELNKDIDKLNEVYLEKMKEFELLQKKVNNLQEELRERDKYLKEGLDMYENFLEHEVSEEYKNFMKEGIYLKWKYKIIGVKKELRQFLVLAVLTNDKRKKSCEYEYEAYIGQKKLDLIVAETLRKLRS